MAGFEIEKTSARLFTSTGGMPVLWSVDPMPNIAAPAVTKPAFANVSSVSTTNSNY
jgi:hypothetical protein